MKGSDKSKIPAWATEPFDRFLEYHKRIHDFYHLSIGGFQAAVFSVERKTELLDQLKVLYEESKLPKSVEDSDYPSETERKLAGRAKSELGQDLPILHESQTILLWSSLEWLIDDFLVKLFSNKPELLKADHVQKISVSLAEYALLDGDEKYHYIVNELKRDLKVAFKHGVDRFESILGLFGMSGVVEANVRRDLLELENVRNILVHRMGVADTKLVHNCPWMQVRSGQKVAITEKHFERYNGAVFSYVSMLITRLGTANL